jgi:hypothetical protein
MRNKTWLQASLAVLLGALLAFLVPVHKVAASLSTITGTINGPDGTPVNGSIVFTLSNPCTDTTLNVAVSAQPVLYQITNGTLPASAQLERNDQCQPGGTYYRADVFDQNNSLIYEANYVITGTTFNIGQAVPVNITTSQLSFQNPAFINVPQTWTATQTFTAFQWNSGTSFLGILTHTNTANRSYQFPDIAGGVCITSAGGCANLTSPTILTPAINGVTITDAPAGNNFNSLFSTSPTAAGWNPSCCQVIDSEAGVQPGTPLSSVNASSTSLQTFGTPTVVLPAGILNVLNRRLHIISRGTWQVLTNPTTVSLTPSIGATALDNGAVVVTATGAPLDWYQVTECTTTAIGTSGKLSCWANTHGSAVALTAQGDYLMIEKEFQPTTVTLNLTISNNLTYGIAFSAGSVSNIGQLFGSYVEVGN